MSGIIIAKRELNTTGQLKVGSSNVIEAYVGDKLVFPVLKPLDYYTGSYGAYSVRQLTGSAVYAMRVRRSLDNATQDIGFDASGSLNEAALLSFVGSGNGFVSIWYDQSSAANHLTPVFSDSARQPQIVSNGSVIKTNSRPALSFDGVNDCLVGASTANYITANGLFFTFAVGKQNNTSAAARVMAHIDNNSAYRISQLIRTSTTNIQAIGFNTSNTPATDTGPSVGTNQFISYTVRTSTAIEIYANGTTNGATSATNPQTLPSGQTTTLTVGLFNASVPANTFGWDGTIQEIIHFPLSSAVYTNYRKGLTARIRAYYNTY